jgi:hypothetical protein
MMGRTRDWPSRQALDLPGPPQVLDYTRSIGAGNEARTRDLDLGKIGF